MQALSDDQQMERLETKVDQLDTRMNGLGSRMVGLETRMVGLETRMVGLETKVERLETKLDDGLDAVRGEARADYRTLVGIQLTMLLAMILGFAGILLQHL
jgi:predicted  nucleic acid-binding Zn-ribbon protein